MFLPLFFMFTKQLQQILLVERIPALEDQKRIIACFVCTFVGYGKHLSYDNVTAMCDKTIETLQYTVHYSVE